MKLAILQPYVMPYLGYFQLYNFVDKFIFLNDVNYIKKGWINRNKIIVTTGEEFLFTVPLSKVSQNKKINQTNLAENYPEWKEKFKRIIHSSYKKFINFSEVFPIIESILETTETIDKLAIKSINQVAKYLEIEKITEESTNYSNQNLKGQDRIIDICKLNQAETYVNPIGGTDLYSKDDFKKEKIELKFLKMNDDLPKLSIIDVLMNYSKVDILKMLEQFECK